jgi:uncharacterized coiled-coil protein SlyX
MRTSETPEEVPPGCASAALPPKKRTFVLHDAVEDEGTRTLQAQCTEQATRIADLEQALAIQKREHERTTSKLTLLLKKRGLDSDFDASERELAGLRQEVTLLKWQKSQAEDRANRLELSSRLQSATAPGAGAGYPSAPQRTASIPSRQVTPEDISQAQRWRKPMMSATPNVAVAPQAKRKLTIPDESVAGSPASSFCPSVTTSQPMAFGYQPGAIRVQQPKRQRVPIAAATPIVVGA